VIILSSNNLIQITNIEFLTSNNETLQTLMTGQKVLIRVDILNESKNKYKNIPTLFTYKINGNYPQKN